MNDLVYTADSEEQTEAFGAALAEHLSPGSVVALRGTLGAGKTRLAQAIATALDVPRREVASPTFVLVHEYRGRLPVYHLDAYRVADADELLQIGVEEYFDSEGVTLVEWADRVAECLPDERLDIHIEVTGPTSRRLSVCARGTRYEPILAALVRWAAN